MTSGRLKDLLSHVRQSDATRDATRDKGLSHAVASPEKNDPRCDTRATNFCVEDMNDINDIATQDTGLSHVASPRACDTRQTHTLLPLSPAALADLPPEDAACPWWRVSIVGPRALNIELEMRSAWTVSDWGRFARRHYGPDATVVARVRPEPEPVTEEGAAEDLRPDLSGISPEFAARLSPEDLDDIAVGDIPLGTVQGFEQAAIAREAEDLREFFEERISILEHDAGLPRPEAELLAVRITAILARNWAYLWASLRSALSGYPDLASQVPATPGAVDSLHFGTATVHEREGAKLGPVSGSIVITEAEIEAACKGRLVVRQGTFTGAQEVKA